MAKTREIVRQRDFIKHPFLLLHEKKSSVAIVSFFLVLVQTPNPVIRDFKRVLADTPVLRRHA
jgi:hypothetical protein